MRDDDDVRLKAYLLLAQDAPHTFAAGGDGAYEILLNAHHIAVAKQAVLEERRAQGLSCDDLRVGILADDPYLRLLREAVRFPDGSFGLYNRLTVPAGVSMLPVFREQILLIYRFRHGTRGWHLEAPRGSLSLNASIEDDVRRELQEEIGATTHDLVPLGQMHATSGCSNELHHLFVAHITSYGTPDPHEAIKDIRLFDVAQFEALARDGRITDAPTLVTFLRARLQGVL
jgi:ADP-ribose pyrophosphatase